MLNPQLEKAASFLALHQDIDGHWRDYRLEPGESEAWTTACVGFALFQVAGLSPEVNKAVDILLSTIRPGGWGYNSSTACDADTTSWVIRFLSSIGAVDEIDTETILDDYIDEAGRVHTFSSSIRFGRWGEEHDEVAPLMGMALLSSGEICLAEKIRQGILKRTSWTPFWWRCYSYVCAQSLEFLTLSGGIPGKIKEREAEALACLPSFPSSDFDLAHRLLATFFLGGELQYNLLLDTQKRDGGWFSSPELFVPHQGDGFSGEPMADEKRLMSTSMSILALLK